VNIKVNDPAVIIAASAPAESNGDSTHYHLEAARTFAFSASDKFKVAESAVGTVAIRSYYFAGDENASQAVVWMATQSLGLYGVKFAPYPYPSLSVVETEVPDGQEFDGLVFLAEKFYSDYNGTAKSNLVTIGTHEIAHQWWFGLVGDDQALEPWLDEALAVYSEKIFYEYDYPRYGDWWWNFRVNYFGPSGWVDTTIYNGGTFRLYTNAVYLNGANFLDDLRTRLGDEALFAFLQDYALRFAHGRATTHDFFAVLRQHTDADFSDIMRMYFQNQY
jgi:aminopeptidase N